MAGVNKAIILGRLGRDPEMKYSQGGTEVCRFSLAVSEKYNGEERTEWFNCVAFGKTAEVANKYLHKGDQAFIEGRIQARKWTGKNGQDRTATEIIVASLTLLGGGKASGAASQTTQRDDRRPSNGDDPFNGDTPF